ncbi:hypothetical protein BGZ83_006141 [Gryganskiella cystojenkinii]|nr:hypothetical protein BGZ83_006141 [Gryganskiella cystojenkinii]
MTMTSSTLFPFLPTQILWPRATKVVVLLAFLLYSPTSTHALPLSPSTLSPSTSIPSLPPISPSSSPLSAIQPALNGSPFRRLSRPITIQAELAPSLAKDDLHSKVYSDPLQHLLEGTEHHEQELRFLQQEALLQLQTEQDRLEREEQDRDQLQDNEEEQQEDEDAETVRRRQEEALGLWMTDTDFDAFGQITRKDRDDNDLDFHDSDVDRVLSHSNENDHFDLFAEGFKEDPGYLEQENKSPQEDVLSRSGRSSPMRMAKEVPTEDEMLQWPLVNSVEFEDRQDEIHDEYDEQA